MTTQVNVQLIEDTLDKRPDPVKVPVGTFFLDQDTGDLYVVAKIGGVHVWVAENGSGSSGVTRNIYANPTTGNDANPGTITKPVRTFQRAVALIPSGYTGDVNVNLAAGTFDDIAPVPGTEYTFGASSSAPREAVIRIRGELGITDGPFTTTGDSDPGGTVIPLGGTPAPDQFLGAVFVIQSSPDSSLVGQTLLVAQNDGVGNTTVVTGFGTTVPMGTVVAIARPATVLPYSHFMILQNNAPVLYFQSLLLQRSHGFVIVVNAGGELTIGGGAELDLGNGGGKRNWASVHGTIRFGTFPSTTTLGAQTLDLSGSAAYVHRASIDTNIDLSTNNAGVSPGNVSFDACVLNHIFTLGFSGATISAEGCELVDTTLECDNSGELDVIGCVFRGQVAGGLPYLIGALFGVQLFSLFNTYNDFTTDAVFGDQAGIASVGDAGAGAVGSGYGFRIRDVSNIVFGGPPPSVSGDAGDVLIDGNGNSADIPVLYAAVSPGAVTDLNVNGTLCRVSSD